MRRVTPEEVQAAFRQTGFKPYGSIYYKYPEKTKSGWTTGLACGIGVLAVIAGKKESECSSWLDSNFDIRYLRGFGYAFYGHESLTDEATKFDRDGILQLGFSDGQAVHNHLISVSINALFQSRRW
jgi:hypothetical protein